MPENPMNTALLGIDLPGPVLELVRRAVALSGESVSEFVVNAASEATEQAIAQRELIQLTPEEQNQFAEGLINPPRVAEALKRAWIAHRDLLDPS